jgi:hypothetical protein
MKMAETPTVRIKVKKEKKGTWRIKRERKTAHAQEGRRVYIDTARAPQGTAVTAWGRRNESVDINRAISQSPLLRGLSNFSKGK